MAIDIIDTSKAAPLTQEEIDCLPLWRRPDWTEDAESVLHKRLDQLQGLANCLSFIGYAKGNPDTRAELAAEALPMLGLVIEELTMDAVRAKDVLVRQHQQTVRGGRQ